jgi:hypothetical protein
VDTVELIRLLLSGGIQDSQRSSLTSDGSHFDENPNRTKAKLYQMGDGSPPDMAQYMLTDITPIWFANTQLHR